MLNDHILATFDTTPSLHRRINAPSLLLAFARINGEGGAGAPTEGIGSEMVGRNGPVFSVCVRRRGGLLSQETAFVFCPLQVNRDYGLGIP
jgi:hypothetical protein